MESNSGWQAIRSFAEGEIASWEGLSLPCLFSSMPRPFSKRPGYGVGRLGQTSTEFFILDLKGFDTPIRVWATGDSLLAADLSAIGINDRLPTLLGALGEPEAKLDCFIGANWVGEGEWVFPKRGIALFLHPKSERLDQVCLFHSCSLEKYHISYRLDLQTKRLPRR